MIDGITLKGSSRNFNGIIRLQLISLQERSCMICGQIICLPSPYQLHRQGILLYMGKNMQS